MNVEFKLRKVYRLIAENDKWLASPVLSAKSKAIRLEAKEELIKLRDWLIANYYNKGEE